MTEAARRSRPLRLVGGLNAETPPGDGRTPSEAGPARIPPRRIPRVPADAFARPRLLAMLHGVWDLAIVHGPGGSGKTTLVAQWAAGRDEVRWFEAEEFRAAYPDDGGRVAALTALFGASDGIVAVVDAADEVDLGLIRDVGAALDRSPGIRLVLTTRSRRVVEELGTASDAALLAIATEELRVTEEEVAAAAPALSPLARRELLDDSNGLVLAVRALLAADGDRLRARGLAQLRAVAASRPPGYLDALALFGVFREVSAGMAARLGIDPELLPVVEEDGLGWLQDGRLHVTAFATELLAPLAAGIADRDALIRLVLDEEWVGDRPVESLRLALLLRDFDRATEVVVQHGFFVFGDARGVRRAFAGVEPASLDRHPLLLALLAQLSMMEASTRARGLRLFGQVVLSLGVRAKQVSPRDAAVFRAVAATLLRFTPIADQAMGRVRKAQRQLSELGLDRELRLGRSGAQLLTHFALTAFASGEERVADEELAEAFGQLHELRAPEQVDPLTLRAAFLAYRGELPAARELVTRAEESTWPEGWREGATAQGVNLARGILALETGRADEASEHLVAGGPIGDLLEHWPLFAAVRAWRDALAGDVLAGRARLEEVRRRRGRGTTTSVQLARMDAADSLLAFMAGDLAAARTLARSASGIPAGGIALARVQLGQGRAAEAAASLQRLAASDLSVREQVEADLLRALLNARAGDREAAAALLGRVAAAVAEQGLLVPLVSLPEADRATLAELGTGLPGLVDALERARPGRRFDPQQVPPLTKRELLVLDRLADAESTAELAAALHVSVNTVKSQLRSVYRKLGVTTREQAIARSAALGLGPLPGDQ